MEIIFYSFIVLFIAVILASLYYFKKPNTESSIKDLYAEGLDMLVMGKRKIAYKNFKKIVDHDSSNIKAYLHLGQVLRESGSPQKALKIHKGLTIRQNLTSYDLLELHKNMSLDYFALGNINRAIEEALRVIKLDQKNTWAISKLMNFYIELNDWTKATEYLEKFHKINKTKDNHKLGLFVIQQGRSLQNNQEFDAARRKFEKALAIDVDLTSTYYFIAETFSKESDKYFNRAEKIDDKNDQKHISIYLQ